MPAVNTEMTAPGNRGMTAAGNRDSIRRKVIHS